MKKLLSIFIILAITALLLELVLRIYNPIYVPLRANQIVLPVNSTFIRKIPNKKKLDQDIVNRYNGLGLRGPDYPTDPEKHIKIITVGGSTTACQGLSDSQTWPARLATK